MFYSVVLQWLCQFNRRQYSPSSRLMHGLVAVAYIRLYYDYHAHICDTTTTRQRKAPLPVGALLWFSVRHVDNELIIVITHVRARVVPYMTDMYVFRTHISHLAIVFS